MTASSPELLPLDAQLLNQVQRGIPFEPRPFAELGRRVGATEEECLQRLRSLREERRIIRQISAIFDTQALGYQSSLVAARFAQEPATLIDQGAAIIGGHPGVSHNYRRSNVYNLWYTLAVPPDSRLGLERTVARLHELSGAQSTRMLPTLKLYKIGVKLDVGAPALAPGGENQVGEAAGDESAGGGSAASGGVFTAADRELAKSFTLTDVDKRLIVVLQQNMELIPEPFAPWAQQAGCSVEELLAACRRFEERRQMRRFAAVLHHRQAGFGANVMGVWQVEGGQEAIDRCGAIMARCAAVSHCYQRPAYDDWPYHVYTMVHGKSRDDCLATLAQLKEQSGCRQSGALWSVHEYKKVRVRYFTPETAQWEERYGSAHG